MNQRAPVMSGQKIAIIGGGVCGLGIGWRLAQAGCIVDVFDRAKPGTVPVGRQLGC